jgi:hypothetical protein
VCNFVASVQKQNRKTETKYKIFPVFLQLQEEKLTKKNRKTQNKQTNKIKEANGPSGQVEFTKKIANFLFYFFHSSLIVRLFTEK